MQDPQPFVVIPNWNGKDTIEACLDSLQSQSLLPRIIVVENGSNDGSRELIQKKYPKVELLTQNKNFGFAGGVNIGIRHAMDQAAEYIALLNNDAVVEERWLENLYKFINTHTEIGIATCKILSSDKHHIDSTGDFYTTWGLPYPRGRSEEDSGQYDSLTEIFAASGGASLYRVQTLKQIGLFDESFFAYYEDVDLSFRAQLAGWKVGYVPNSVAYHQIGATSGKLKGFTTYQTLKNLPLLLHKNVPRRYKFRVGWRYMLAHWLFFLSALKRGQGWYALKGDLMGTYLLCTSGPKRRRVKRLQKVPDEYIWNMIVHDLPANAHKLRALRAKWWRLIGKKAQSK